MGLGGNAKDDFDSGRTSGKPAIGWTDGPIFSEFIGLLAALDISDADGCKSRRK
jgi:hypothetical protein